MIRSLVISLFLTFGVQWATLAQAPPPYLLVLGNTQDGGYPQAGCIEECCQRYYIGESDEHWPVSLALVDQSTNEYFMIDATLNMNDQMMVMYQNAGLLLPNRILLSHAHVGHYAGLMNLGREIIGANSIPVYAMPKMTTFIKDNGPWSQLVKLKNIELNPLVADEFVQLSADIKVKPILVPHRDEFSEAVGFFIKGPSLRALYITDIDSWEKWDESLSEWIQKVDVAFLDGTFFDETELPNRDKSEIPHPTVKSTMALLKDLPSHEKSKVFFTHFNHTNPLLDPNSVQSQEVKAAGFNLAEEGLRIGL